MRFVLLHKLREAMAAELKGRMIRGEGKTAEIDSGCFGGHVKPANLAEKHKDRRFAANQSGSARRWSSSASVTDSLRAAFRAEGQELNFVRSRTAKDTVVNADGSAAWNDLHARFEMKRINHEEAYSLDGACTKLGGGIFQPHAPC